MTELTEDEFCTRFVAEMMKSVTIYAGTEAELREYAEEVAPCYYVEDWQREEGPEACAAADVSYWGD